MKTIYFRGEPLINRDKEKNFIKEYFTKQPKKVLWIYGPKSTGKTTLIEYIVENELFEDFKLFKSSKYNVKYINFRRKVIGNYDNFINSMLLIDDHKLDEKLKLSFSLRMFKIEYELYEQIKKRQIDLFDTLIEQLKSSKKRNIIIIDEIQALQDIYINKEKILLNEFLNFCVSLTKETHLSHVVILSSNTIFINEIYENSKLKKTSEFYKIDHLPFEEIKKWLKGSWDNKHIFSDEEIELIWDYLGGSISDIQKLLTNFCELKTHSTLKEYLENEARLADSEIFASLRSKRKQRKDSLMTKEFKLIAKEILDNGYALVEDKDSELFDEMLDYFCEKEILFYEPSEKRVYPNSRIYVKAMEMLVDN
jgi:AAA+ ATPase superfamily predicted ATPase